MDKLKDQYPAEWNDIAAYRTTLLQEEIFPIRRGRLTIIGKGRSGKSSVIRALRGERFDAAMASTVGIDIADATANVREIGTTITNNDATDKCWAQIPTNLGHKEFAVKMNLLQSTRKKYSHNETAGMKKTL